MSRGLIVAAPATGMGKTTVTAGLIRAFGRRGRRVRPAKSGPDYIDAAFHAAAAGLDCVNLDTWAMAPDLLDAILAEAAADADLVLIEAAMGLFDGLPGPAGRTGSAADLAARYSLPVLLVMDVGGQSQTAAAIARGIAGHDPNVRVAGVVLNRVASERHRGFLADAFARVPIAVFGALPRDEKLAFPSRHLGLVQAGEHADLETKLDALADAVEANLDLDSILAATTSPLIPAQAGTQLVEGLEAVRRRVIPSAPIDRPGLHNLGPRLRGDERGKVALPPPGRRIALARDRAFSFVYPHIVAGWRQAGAEVVAFSPLADEPPSGDCDSCWLPGGYPELHAGALAAASGFHRGLTEFARTRPVHGECGGYMVLGEWLEDAAGVRHGMTGLLGHGTSFATRRLALGYREARLLAGGAAGPAGTVVRGHEFHYSTLAQPGADQPFAEAFDGQGRSLGRVGGRRGLVSGAYFHAIAAG